MTTISSEESVCLFINARLPGSNIDVKHSAHPVQSVESRQLLASHPDQPGRVLVSYQGYINVVVQRVLGNIGIQHHLSRLLSAALWQGHVVTAYEARASSALRASVICTKRSWLPPISGCAFWARRRKADLIWDGASAPSTGRFNNSRCCRSLPGCA